jgi:hypothetical protein
MELELLLRDEIVFAFEGASCTAAARDLQGPFRALGRHRLRPASDFMGRDMEAIKDGICLRALLADDLELGLPDIGANRLDLTRQSFPISIRSLERIRWFFGDRPRAAA